MKFITKLSIFLILLASMFFAVKFSSAQEIDSLKNISESKYPYKIVEIYPDGSSGKEYLGESASSKLADITKDLKAFEHEKDKLKVFPELYMQMGGTITIFRTPTFKIIDGKKNYSVRSWAQTVGGVLSENKIELGQDDKINFSEDTEATDSMQIKIVRVAKTIIIERENIEYKTIKKFDSNLEKGNKRTETSGTIGTRAKHYLSTREDGVEISRVLQKTEIEKEPVSEVVTIGTKIITLASGEASWYKAPSMTAACRDVPKGTMVRVVNVSNGKSVVVRINDWIGYPGRVIDLSSDAFAVLAPLGQGTIKNVRLEKYYPE